MPSLYNLNFNNFNNNNNNNPEIIDLPRPKQTNENEGSDSVSNPTYTSDIKKDDTFDYDFPELKQE